MPPPPTISVRIGRGSVHTFWVPDQSIADLIINSFEDSARMDYLESLGDIVEIHIDADLEGHAVITSNAFQKRTMRAAIDNYRAVEAAKQKQEAQP